MAQSKSQRRTKHCSDVFKNEPKQVLGMVAVTYQDGAELKLGSLSKHDDDESKNVI